jgi:hypothetical protein
MRKHKSEIMRYIWENTNHKLWDTYEKPQQIVDYVVIFLSWREYKIYEIHIGKHKSQFMNGHCMIKNLYWLLKSPSHVHESYLEYATYSLAKKYDILTNPISIPSNALRPNLRFWHPNIAVDPNLFTLQKQSSNLRIDVVKNSRNGIVNSGKYFSNTHHSKMTKDIYPKQGIFTMQRTMFIF